MINIWHILLLICAGVILAGAVMVLQAWIIHKFTKQKNGESFFTGEVPKGEVFTIPEAESAEEFPDKDAEKAMMERTNQFLNILSGGAKT